MIVLILMLMLKNILLLDEFSDLIIKPKKGTLIIFPPLWMFPHKGNPPISESKYLLSTYLHYT